ncbi:MAG: hypothetical protein JO267_06960 [Alphaproteobacteria bacterium]|nr:hypothetical protein [Alphaproteobacteria bacterium]
MLPSLAAGRTSANAAAQAVAGYGLSVCLPVLRGQNIAAASDPSTVTWLGQLAGMIEALVPAAAAIGLM